MTEEKEQYQLAARRSQADLANKELTPDYWAMLAEVGNAHIRVKKALFCFESRMPLSMADSLYVVNGRIGVQSDLVARQVRAHPHYDYDIVELNEKQCTVRIYRINENGDMSPLDRLDNLMDVTFTWKQAERAGLTKKDVWAKYPEDMLFGKAMTRAQRRFAPDALVTPAYTREEMQGWERDVTEADFDIIKPGPTSEQIAAVFTEFNATDAGRIVRECQESGRDINELIDDFRRAQNKIEAHGKETIIEENNGDVPRTLDELEVVTEHLKEKEDENTE